MLLSLSVCAYIGDLRPATSKVPMCVSCEVHQFKLRLVSGLWGDLHGTESGYVQATLFGDALITVSQYTRD